MVELKNTSACIQERAIHMAETYKDCFCWYSEEKYVRGFAVRHLDTIMAINEDEYGTKISKKHQKLFIDTFTEKQLANITEMKKEHNKKEKAQIKKKGVKRKVDK